ncbi:MAG: VacJ family lipoprotein [Desulfobacterales bacterium]
MKKKFSIFLLFFFLLNSADGVSIAQSVKESGDVSGGLERHSQAPVDSTENPVTTYPAESDDEDFEDEDLDYLYENEEGAPQVYAADPLKPWNDMMFNFNDKLYFWILKPVSTGYRAITPDMVRIGARNFFSNLSTPIRFVNCLLQGKGGDAEIEFARFLANTTIGFLGFWDPAKAFQNLNEKEEDFGQTLGVWGIGSGWYIVMPFLGPSTVRDSAGRFGDMFLNPLYYLETVPLSTGVWAFENINDISFRIGDYETIKEAAFDPYESMRDGYLQMRAKKVEQ